MAMRKILVCSLAFIGSVAAVGLVTTRVPAGEDLDPLKVAGDTHKLVLENAFVRVIESKVPAGKAEPKHSHPHGLTVYLANYSIEQKAFPEGKVTKHERKFGTVAWSEAIVHEVKNTGTTPSHAIRIELKH
jgi:hypothetical protein